MPNAGRRRDLLTGEKIFVASSAKETGGPEALHHLVHELRQLGADAYISYLPLGLSVTKPDRFQHYDAPAAAWQDCASNYILLPENETGLVNQIRHARVGIWWLSVDNYFGRKHQSWFKDWYVRLRRLQTGTRAPLSRLKACDHFAQSEYARMFLHEHGIKGEMLGDALRPEFLQLRFDVTKKRDLIAFNPNKGQKALALLQEAYPGFEFVAIQNMTPEQVADLLLQAKIYVDFGHHPGKDRPPREAAMAGCCVITRRQGSAGNPVDVPLPEKYKLADGPSGIQAFGGLVAEIFKDFSRYQVEFDAYRSSIRREPEEFRQQVARLYQPYRRRVDD